MIGDFILALCVVSAIFALASPTSRKLLKNSASAAFVRNSHFFALPMWLLPFGIAIFFERQTRFLPDVLANVFFFNGRALFPLAYVYRVTSLGLSPIVQSGTHLWDLLGWLLISVLFGIATRNMRFKYTALLAPVVILAIAFGFDLFVASSGLRFWGLPARVVG